MLVMSPAGGSLFCWLSCLGPVGGEGWASAARDASDRGVGRMRGNASDGGMGRKGGWRDGDGSLTAVDIEGVPALRNLARVEDLGELTKSQMSHCDEGPDRGQ